MHCVIQKTWTQILQLKEEEISLESIALKGPFQLENSMAWEAPGLFQSWVQDRLWVGVHSIL